ncbi:MAG TPA: archaellin/type IV pilin N-terminal domain-containing protein [Candidatus Thalassarchaeaceae archaeon]|nr:type IV pilin [Candidatus Thalassarchaeaceae archaeon]HJM67771.1 archaellin/type IV pilin N-terminal domain-containing protein [Candidatus Thalassarchaeaceae archaeon]
MKNDMKNEQAVSPVIATILMVAITVVLAGVLYVWANSLAADQPESGTRNSYTADDAAAMTDSGDDNALISMRWQHAEDDLNWAFIVMKLSVGDSTYDCSTDGSEECSIGQDGSDDAVWETGEFLILSESGTDIADGATTIDLYVTYRGTAVAGSDSVTVS